MKRCHPDEGVSRDWPGVRITLLPLAKVGVVYKREKLPILGRSQVALRSHSAAARAPEPNAKPGAGELSPLPLKCLGFPGVGNLFWLLSLRGESLTYLA